MSRIFIERPIFAWVIAIIIVLMGIGAIVSLPVGQYPDVAPTQISIRATYPGASAETLENSVTQVLEQELTGLEGLLYFSSSSTSRADSSNNPTNPIRMHRSCNPCGDWYHSRLPIAYTANISSGNSSTI